MSTTSMTFSAVRPQSWLTHRVVRVTAWTILLGLTAWLVRSEPIARDLPPGIRLEADLAYGPGVANRLDRYRPEGVAPATGWPVIIAFHGGGWRGGSKGEYGREMARLVRGGVAVASVEYTLSRPGAPSWPSNRDDARAAVHWVREHATRLGLDRTRCAVLGASAGGHLAALSALDTRPGEAPAAVVMFYAPTDLTALAGPVAESGGPIALLLGGTLDQQAIRDQARAASPLRLVRPGSPPILLIHGLDDATIPPSQSRSMATALEEAGVPHRLILLRGSAHGFGLDVPGCDLASEILAFLSRTWDDSRILTLSPSG